MTSKMLMSISVAVSIMFISCPNEQPGVSSNKASTQCVATALNCSRWGATASLRSAAQYVALFLHRVADVATTTVARVQSKNCQATYLAHLRESTCNSPPCI